MGRSSVILSTVLMALLGSSACHRPMALSEGDRTSATTASTPLVTPTPEPSIPEATSPVTTGPTPAASTQDYTVIPGQRVGPVTPTTSRQQLAALYGEATLKDGAIAMGEGFSEPGTTVDLGPERHFTVVWLDVDRSRPLLAKDFGPAWKTPEGLGVGVPYSTVQLLLGNFQLYGFAWDYGGTLSLEDSKLDQYYGNLLVRLAPSETALAQHPEAYNAVMGDVLFPSNDPNFALLELSVHEMVVYLNNPVE